MSGFLPKEPTTFLNIKLTDTGRRLLSLGRLTFEKAALSDREINYGFNRQVVNGYDQQINRVLAPKDDHPVFSNFDGSDFVELGPSRVHSVKQIVSAKTDSIGFFTGDTKAGFGYDTSKSTTRINITYSSATNLPNGTNVVGYDLGSQTAGIPKEGQLIHIPWEPIQNSGKTFDSNSFDLDPSNPTNSLWYRVMSASTTALVLDRPAPNFGTITTDQTIRAYAYPFDGVETYYGSATTVSVGVWNMNIVRTSDVIGTSSIQSGYTTYGSVEYNGMKNYFGLSSETKSFGVVHYTNENSGNTYAEQFVEKTMELNLPNVMWHKANADVGKGLAYGLTLFDVAGETIIDPVNNSTYRELRDGAALSNLVVGRVYHKLEVILLTDPELLTALTYKSNRSFTLPTTQLTLSSSPKFPLTSSDATGLCESGKTYFVTYNVESDDEYTPNASFGYPQTLPSSYVQKITGEFDANGDPSFLVVNFPPTSFPYMRSEANMDPNGPFSGTGWNANKIQVMVNEVDDINGFNFDTIPSDGWIKIGSGGVGNGIYTGDTSESTIDPLKLQAHQFVISREDFVSGDTFTLYSGFTDNIDTSINGLSFGSESFFYGTLKTDILATSFKTSITVLANNTQFNSSNNSTFDSVLDNETFITEIGIFNLDNELVAVGKPTYPIKKSDGRFLAFKLEYDF